MVFIAMIDFSYTEDQLVAYIKERLGQAVWRLEGFDVGSSVENAIADALLDYGRQCPKFNWKEIPPSATKHTLDTDRVVTVLDVHFIEPVNRFAFAPLVGISQQLNGVAPMNLAGTMSNVSGDIAEFLMWRKSFQRVTSTKPQWLYDDESFTVFIHNPGRFKACILYTTYRTFANVKPNHKVWLKKAALANAKQQLGIFRRKFDGSIQGPGGTAIKLDGSDLVTEAEKEIEAAAKELRGFRPRAWPVFD